MRFLTALVLAFVVCVGLPTIAAADIGPVSMEQPVADFPDAGAIDFDAEIPSAQPEFAISPHAQRVPLPVATPSRIGPNGFSPEIWRPVDRTEPTLLRNYESGLALNR